MDDSVRYRKQADLHTQFANQWCSWTNYFSEHQTRVCTFHKFVSEEYSKIAEAAETGYPIKSHDYNKFDDAIADQMRHGSYHVEPVHRSLSGWYLDHEVLRNFRRVNRNRISADPEN